MDEAGDGTVRRAADQDAVSTAARSSADNADVAQGSVDEGAWAVVVGLNLELFVSGECVDRCLQRLVRCMRFLEKPSGFVRR